MNANGMHWLRDNLRVALYVRDGLACCYCGLGLKDDATLTLDHLTPRSQGGGNAITNLITACAVCNALRGDRPWEEFARLVGKTKKVIQFIESRMSRRVDVEAANTLLARRGNFTAALMEARHA